MNNFRKSFEVHTSMQRTKLFLSVTALLIVSLAVGCTTDPAKKKAQFTASAEKYYQQRQYSDAAIQYRNALKIDPRSAELHYQLGRTLISNQQYREAVLEYQRAREANPNYAPAQIALGQIALLSNQFDEADKFSGQILSKDPDNKDAVLLHATTLAAKKDFDGAQRVLGDLIAKHPDYAPAYLDRGTFLTFLGKRDEGLAMYEAGLKVDPKSVSLQRALAGAYLQEGDPTSAEKHLQAAVQSNPDSAEARQYLAAFYFAQKRSAEAEKVFQDLVALQKNSPESKFQLASFYMSQSRPADAKRLDAEIAKAKPAYLPARLQLVSIAIDAQKPDEADRLMKDLIHDRPKDPEVLMIDARMQMKKGDSQKALQDLDAVQRLDPRLPTVHYLRGLAQRQAGSNEQAEAAFTEAISLDGKYLEPRLALAQLQMDRGKIDDALATAQQALAINDRTPGALLIAGNAYALKGDLKSAEAQYEKL